MHLRKLANISPYSVHPTVLIMPLSTKKYKYDVSYINLNDIIRDLKPDSRTYKLVEISGHNLESYQTCGFCLRFLH